MRVAPLNPGPLGLFASSHTVFEELVKSVKATLYDRTVSPLFGTFAASWAVWNYKLVIVILSGYSPERTFQYIEDVLYPHWYRAVALLVVGPLATALLFIYLYPWPARKTFEYARRQQQKLLELRNEIDKATLVTRDVWERTQQELSALTAEHAREIERISAERESFKKLFHSRDQQIQVLTEELQTLRARDARATHTLIAPITDHQLLGRNVRMFQAQLPGLEGSKLLELRANGSIGHGRNDNESAWVVEDGRLAFRNSTGEEQSRFVWDTNWRVFRKERTNGPSTRQHDFVVIET